MTGSTALELVAPELVAGLEFFPDLDFSGGMAPFRTGFAERPRMPVPPGLEVVTCAERRIPGLAGEPEVRVLLYTPPGEAGVPRPAVLHMHGGGFVLGDPELNDGSNRAMALHHGCVVVSVDYRLAPETTWTGSLADNFAALCWLHENAAALGVDPARIAVAGESAGGGHAVMLAIHARDALRETGSGPAIRFMLLDAPMLDDRTGTTADPHPHTGHFVWTPEKNRFGWGALLGMEPGGPDSPAAAVPARVADLSGLPPAFISVGALDLFLEEDMEFARRLTRAGVAVEFHIMPGAYHGYGMAQGAPQVARLSAMRSDALERAFAKR